MFRIPTFEISREHLGILQALEKENPLLQKVVGLRLVVL